MPRHLWQGHWIEDAALEARVERLSADAAAALEDGLPTPVLLRACDQLSRRLAQEAGLRSELTSLARAAGCFSETEIKSSIDGIAEFLKRECLERKLRRELGSPDPFRLVRVRDDDAFEAWAPLGLLVHVAPTNALTVGALSVVEGLLAGNVCLLKASGDDTEFPLALLSALAAEDPTGRVARHVIAARVSSKRAVLLQTILRAADGVAAWGGEEALSAVRKLAPSQARFVEWGPKISFAYVAEASLSDATAIESVARSVCEAEQQACSSPQCVYAETDDLSVLDAFANRLAEALTRVSPAIDRIAPGDREAAEITHVTEVARVEEALGRGSRVIAAKDGAWRLLVDPRPGLQASPLFRTAWVKPLPRARIAETLRPLRSYLQTAGLACGRTEVADISERLFRAGVLRVTRPGAMLGSYVGEPHDGVYALQRYCRRVDAQLDRSLADISALDDLRPSQAGVGTISSVPVLDKKGFQGRKVEDRHAQLHFKSGGTSGEPKLSVFTYDDYHLQMAYAAEGLVAAGLDPTRDRCMNLFFGGGLYGGFLSFFTILEHLRATQFPMSAHGDLAAVAKAIVDYRVNTLLGMPSYLLRLFEEQASTLAGAGVRNIFYGGEQLGEGHQTRLRDRFGIDLIRSATYGSVDAGPLVFQCAHCNGSIHHLHDRLQALELVALDADRPAEAGEVGRLVFTSIARAGQLLERYEIGDVGRWIPGPCPCGRASPRFELLGRQGDAFRIGATFLSYSKIEAILLDSQGYSQELQIVLEPGASVECVEVRVCSDPAGFAQTLLSRYEDLREAVQDDRLLELRVVRASPTAMELTPGSGKLRRVIDRRPSGSMR